MQEHLTLCTVLAVLALCVALLWFGLRLLRNHGTERHIRLFGGHGAKCRTWLPYGLDFIFKALVSAVQDEDLLFWNRLFRRHANQHRPYTIEVNATGRRIVYTSDPDNIKAILTDQFDDYGKGRWLNKDWRALFGYSILTTDGVQWHAGRRMLRTQLSKDRMSDLDCLERHIQVLLSKISASDSDVVDAKDLFFRFTLDAGTDFFLGQSVQSLSNVPQGVKFAEALDRCQRFVVLRAMAGKAGGLFPQARFRRDLGTINGFVNVMVQRALLLSDDELAKAESDKSFNFLHTLIMHSRDPTVLRDQLIAVLIGARDTTACCLSWLFYSLAQNQQVLGKLREEVVSTVGTVAAPTYTQMKEMKYLQNTIKETLRLYPSVPYNIRYALKDTSLPRGGGEDGMQPIGILERTPIVYSIHHLHFTPKHYPPAGSGFPHPSHFVPERWDRWHPRPWTYLPFNGGPRLCVGQQFALTEVAYSVVRILQRHESINWLGSREPVYSSSASSGGNLVEEFMAHQCLAMRSEVVMAPHGEVRLGFGKASERR